MNFPQIWDKQAIAPIKVPLASESGKNKMMIIIPPQHYKLIIMLLCYKTLLTSLSLSVHVHTYIMLNIQGVFLTGTPPKSYKYKQVNLD